MIRRKRQRLLSWDWIDVKAYQRESAQLLGPGRKGHNRLGSNCHTRCAPPYVRIYYLQDL